MAQPPPQQPESPRPWYAGLIGFFVAALVLGAAAAATAVSYDSDGTHGEEHSDDAEYDEHGEDDEHAEDDDHGEDDDHSDE